MARQVRNWAGWVLLVVPASPLPSAQSAGEVAGWVWCPWGCNQLGSLRPKAPPLHMQQWPKAAARGKAATSLQGCKQRWPKAPALHTQQGPHLDQLPNDSWDGHQALQRRVVGDVADDCRGWWQGRWIEPEMAARLLLQQCGRHTSHANPKGSTRSAQLRVQAHLPPPRARSSGQPSPRWPRFRAGACAAAACEAHECEGVNRTDPPCNAHMPRCRSAGRSDRRRSQLRLTWTPAVVTAAQQLCHRHSNFMHNGGMPSPTHVDTRKLKAR